MCLENKKKSSESEKAAYNNVAHKRLSKKYQEGEGRREREGGRERGRERERERERKREREGGRERGEREMINRI